jgi:hypothetical protein
LSKQGRTLPDNMDKLVDKSGSSANRTGAERGMIGEPEVAAEPDNDGDWTSAPAAGLRTGFLPANGRLFGNQSTCISQPIALSCASKSSTIWLDGADGDWHSWAACQSFGSEGSCAWIASSISQQKQHAGASPRTRRFSRLPSSLSDAAETRQVFSEDGRSGSSGDRNRA